MKHNVKHIYRYKAYIFLQAKDKSYWLTRRKKLNYNLAYKSDRQVVFIPIKKFNYLLTKKEFINIIKDEN